MSEEVCEELVEWTRDTFHRLVYTGPAYAWMELPGGFRATYELFLFGVSHDPNRISDLKNEFRATIEEMKARGGAFLFWRVMPTLAQEEGVGGGVNLRARFAVLDRAGNQVRMRHPHIEGTPPSFLGPGHQGPLSEEQKDALRNDLRKAADIF